MAVWLTGKCSIGVSATVARRKRGYMVSRCLIRPVRITALGLVSGGDASSGACVDLQRSGLPEGVQAEGTPPVGASVSAESH